MNVYDTNLVLAIRCSNCGKIKFHSISVFRFPLNEEIKLYCDCGNDEICIKLKDNKKLVIDIPCLACDVSHTYIYDLRDILRRRVSIICCSDTGFELCFMGRDSDVRNIVSRYQEDLNLLLGELGFITGPAKI